MRARVNFVFVFFVLFSTHLHKFTRKFRPEKKLTRHGITMTNLSTELGPEFVSDGSAAKLAAWPTL